ncbi:MAG: ABC transporter substrate-binding protein [Spirochaetales bacterium]|nr:ABC transporter substrate-binding protein [Spirochaetales bacterium]
MKKLLVPFIVAVLVVSSAFAGGSAEKAKSNIVKIGLVTAVTGPNSLVGEEATEGAKLAIEQINAKGGVNGQMLELIVADEVNNAEASVLATQELLANPEIVGIVGSMYSAYCIAAMPSVAEAGVPFICLGSSSGVSKEKNRWTWQDRPLDTAQGKVVANFVVDTLKCKNPAIMHSTQSTFQSLYEQVFAALKEKGLNITEARNEFGFPEDTSNYAPYIAQVMAGDYDCLIALGNQNPAGVICQQVAQAGLTSARMPLVGSTSWCSNVCITAAGDAANGWYSISDWCPGGSNETAAQFEKDYCAYSGRAMSDLAAACAYDAVYILAEAMKIAGTNTDKAKINEAMKHVEFEGAISYFKYNEDHSFASTLTVTQNINGKVVPQFAIQYR